MLGLGLAFEQEPLESVLPSKEGPPQWSPPLRPKDLREPPDAEGAGEAAAALPLALVRALFERFLNSREALGIGG